MPGCIYVNCNSRSNKTFKLIKVPTEEERRSKWDVYLVENGRNYPSAKKYWVCERNFDFYEEMSGNLIRAKDPSLPQTVWINVVRDRINFYITSNVCCAICNSLDQNVISQERKTQSQ